MIRVPRDKRITMKDIEEGDLVKLYNYAMVVAKNRVKHERISYQDIAATTYTTLLEILQEQSTRQIELKSIPSKDVRNWIVGEIRNVTAKELLYQERFGHQYPDEDE
jgi:uncharacterized protein YqiB (DUF1249 family)